MSNNANVDVNYEDSDGMGNVTLMALPFGKSGKDFYAKVETDTTVSDPKPIQVKVTYVRVLP